MKKNVFFVGLLSVLLFCFGSCSDDMDENENIGGNNVPELLYGKWNGSDRRGQSLTFIVYKNGKCAYKRASYVDEEGSYVYDAAEKKITTTIREIGEGPVVYIIELLDADNLVVKEAAYDTNIAYRKDHSFHVD